jgi:hypothetical protein
MKRKPFIPIGVKLIGIVSLILVGSLGGMMLLATGNFGRTMERTLKDDTMNRAELLSKNVERDLRSVIAPGGLLAAEPESSRPTSRSPRPGNAKSRSASGLPFSRRRPWPST